MLSVPHPKFSHELGDPQNYVLECRFDREHDRHSIFAKDLWTFGVKYVLRAEAVVSGEVNITCSGNNK